MINAKSHERVKNTGRPVTRRRFTQKPEGLFIFVRCQDSRAKLRNRLKQTQTAHDQTLDVNPHDGYVRRFLLFHPPRNKFNQFIEGRNWAPPTYVSNVRAILIITFSFKHKRSDRRKCVFDQGFDKFCSLHIFVSTSDENKFDSFFFFVKEELAYESSRLLF